MEKVKIYSKETCPYCIKAKNWFKTKNIEYKEVLLNSSTIPQFIRDCPNAKTVPQIIVCGELIGGFDQLEKNTSRIKTLLGM